MPQTERVRLSRDRLKALLLEAGSDLLTQDGLGSGTAPIGYAQAFRWLEDNRNLTISRAQVHRRIWNSVNDYRREVLSIIAGSPPPDGYNAAVASAFASLDPESVTQFTMAEREYVLVDFARNATRTHSQSLRDQQTFAAFDAIYALLAFGGELGKDDLNLQEAVRSGRREVLGRFSTLYAHVARIFEVHPGGDLGLDPATGIDLFAEVMECVVHGSTGRSTFESSLLKMPIGGEEWTVEGLLAAAATKKLAGFTTPCKSDVAPQTAVPEPVGPSPAPPPLDSSPSGRLERSVLRQHMIDAGIAVLFEAGFGHGAEHITYGRVFERLRKTHGISVSRAQVHNRIWASQDDYQVEVLRTVVGRSGGMFAPESTEEIAAALERSEITDVASQRIAMARVCRSGSNRSVESLQSSTGWILSKAVMAFHALNRNRKSDIGNALHDIYEEDIAGWANRFELVAAMIGYEARPWTGCTIGELSVIVARCVDVLSEGVIGRTRVQGAVSSYEITTDGEKDRWSLLAIGVWCVVDFLAEPNRSAD